MTHAGERTGRFLLLFLPSVREARDISGPVECLIGIEKVGIGTPWGLNLFFAPHFSPGITISIVPTNLNFKIRTIRVKIAV